MRSNLSRVVSGLVSRVVSGVVDRLAHSRPAGIAAGTATVLLALSTATALGISSLLENPGLPPASGALAAGRNALQAALVVNAGADDPGLAAGAPEGASEGGAPLTSGGGDDARVSAAITTLAGGRAPGDELYGRSLAAAGSHAAGRGGGSSLLRASLGGLMGTGMLATALSASQTPATAMADTGTTEAVTPATPTDPLAGSPPTPADTSRAATPPGTATGSDAGSGAAKGPAAPRDTSKAANTPGRPPAAAPVVAVVTPEPGTFLLLGAGLVALGGVGLRRRRRA